MTSKLLHPCAKTCSGYRAGYDKAIQDIQDRKLCPCGKWMIADTEDCRTPLCPGCFEDIKEAIKKK